MIVPEEGEVLEGARILMTGMTGQVAGGVVRKLAGKYDIIGLARYSRPGSRDELEALGVRTVKGDFATGELGDVPDDIDYVVHFAANTRPGDPEFAMVQNADGTGLLMHRCRKAKAFLHVSTTGVYLDNPNPYHVYKETDPLGGSTLFSPNYGASKIAAEGIVRALSRILGLPATIARLDSGYGGPYDDGGLPGIHLDSLMAGNPIRIPTRACMHSPIHEDDLAEHIGPLLQAASVPATIVNWGGSEAVSVEEWIRYMAALADVEPYIEHGEDWLLPNCIPDTEYGRSLGLQWKVHWKDGFRRTVAQRYPELTLKGGS